MFVYMIFSFLRWPPLKCNVTTSSIPSINSPIFKNGLLKDISAWFGSKSTFSTHRGLPFWCTWYFWWGWLTVHYAHVHHMRESSHLGWKQWCAWKNPIIDKIIIILSILILIFPHDTAFEKISFSPWVLHQPAVTTKWAVRAVGRDGALQLEL